jgi:transposase-like protein
MPCCSWCGRLATKRHGHDGFGRQRFGCRPCRRKFTATSASAFSDYRWPPEVILTAVRWYLSHPLSATSVMVFLAERGIDVSQRTVLRWVQTFGPLLAAEVRKPRRRPGRRWWVDEMFFFRRKGQEKRYLYRAIDEQGQVLDVLFRDQRDTASAEAFFRQTLRRTGTVPTTLISDHHQPYIRAVQEVFPEATHLRTGLHRATGQTTNRSSASTSPPATDYGRREASRRSPPVSGSSRGSRRCRPSTGGTSRLTGSCPARHRRRARPRSGPGPWPWPCTR